MLNTALVRIANWKFRDGRILRLRDLKSRLMFNTGAAPTGTVITAAASSVIIPGLATNYAGEFDNWVIVIDTGVGAGQTALVRSSILSGTDIQLYIEPAWTTTPDSTSTYSLYKSFFAFIGNPVLPWEQFHIPVDPIRHMGDIIRVRDVTGLTDLERAPNDDLFTANMRSLGIPSLWRAFGGELWFDVAPSEPRAYEILFIKNPSALVGANDVPEIPEMYHEAAALWLTHNLMRQHQDFNAAYATKRELEDLMEMLRLQGSFDMDADIGGITVWG